MSKKEENAVTQKKYIIERMEKYLLKMDLSLLLDTYIRVKDNSTKSK